MAYRNYITLNGVDLTDQGRTMDESREERSVKLELANGSLRKYFKVAPKKKWTIEWNWVPNLANKTIDLKGGRDAIKAIAEGITSYTYVVHNAAGDLSYTVFVEDYSEDLLRRDYLLGCNFYKISLELIEV